MSWSTHIVHATVADTLLRELQENGDARKQALYRACRENGPIPFPLIVPLPEFASPSLLDRVQNRPDVESNLRVLRKRRTKDRDNAVYIQPQAKPNQQDPDDKLFPLMETVKGFLASNQKVFLLLGDSGAGKSSFNRELEYNLWQDYKSKTDRIPLHINLAAIEKPQHDMIAKQLRKEEFSEPQIRELKLSRRFVLICDGYDESQETGNLYVTNQLNQKGGWDVQMVVSCRSEYLGKVYRDKFQPEDRNKKPDSSLFQEAAIAPFTFDQVKAYIKEYVAVHQPLWCEEDYNRALELIPSLKDLVKNPFLMTLALEVLPRMMDPGEHLSTAHVTRVALYDHFVEQWLERGKKRVGDQDLSPQAKAAFKRLSDEGFTVNGIEYLKRLAVAIYKEQDGYPVVQYSQLKDEKSWKDEFFKKEHKQLLLEACPLKRNGNQHRFIHRSLLEYGLTRAVFDPQVQRDNAASEANLGRRGSVGSVLSFEIHDSEQDKAAAMEQETDADSPLVWRSFVKDYSLMQFLEERVQQEPVFKEQLLAYIEHSKTDKKWRTAAANAITILVRAGIQFIGTDLRGIQIPGADLSYGTFDSVQLHGADLRKVNLQGAWMRQTDLTGAQMAGVQFGEFPSLHENTMTKSCAYSPDGTLLAVGLKTGAISVYTTSNFDKCQTLTGHSKEVQSVKFSPTSDQIVSCSVDMTVRLWSVETGSCEYTLNDHTGDVNCVAYSPLGDQIASASDDKAIRVWDITTKDYRHVLSGHTESVLCVAYSRDGKQIASGSSDFTIRMWDVETGVCSHHLTDHVGKVWDITYSPQGTQLASASWDGTVRLWDVDARTCSYVLVGHGRNVYSVAYSPKGDQVASGGQDMCIRLWDAETGASLHTLTGRSGTVTSVVYSPIGNTIASGSGDETVRLWDLSARTFRHVSSGHSGGVMSVHCSPKGDRVVSCSADITIRVWDVKTGNCYRTLTGHSKTIFGVAYLPQGERVVSGGSDATVQLWDVETGTWQRTFTGHEGWVKGVAHSPQGDLVASVSHDKTVRVWDVETGNCCRTLIGHTNEVLCIAYSPNSNRIASGDKDCVVRLWNMDSDNRGGVLLRGHGSWIRSVAFSPLGDQLASGSGDKTIKLWNVATGDCRLTLTGHELGLLCVAYSQKGDLLASGGFDETVRIWDVASGQCRAVIKNLPGYIGGIDWTSHLDAIYLVTGGGDGSVLKWQVLDKGDQCRAHLCWSATNGSLTMTGASIQGVQGLTLFNERLLKQRGAVGEPDHAPR